MAAAMRADRAGPLPRAVPGLSIDTRSIKPGEAFFAIQGENRDGHEFVEAALKAGAGLAVVSREKAGAMPKNAPLLLVDDVLGALNDLARASRARSRARIVAVTGSVGKTSTKEALPPCSWPSGRDARGCRLVQQSLGCAAYARADAAVGAVRRVRDRNESRGRDHAARRPGAPACCDDHHDCAGAPGILRNASTQSRTPRRKSLQV